ncbi:methyl-accepting chemotaxis protein [Acetivibrio straminisolvens]|jgi:methyl-accepting chemotaxis protein|uniref:methyl-accepting chemotaxis protein n=1 Tax=Acetivibrio straminisolvens TaxID=253314 RepID=UPI00223FB961|nr:methyl-accepting chemotaxis protein [Acetivibrio straminisolvens]
MLKNMAIRTKLLTIVSITVAALLIVTILSLVTINGIFNKVKTSIFDELFWSMSMILNADRDMYQAYVAILEIANLQENSEEYDKSLQDYEENIEQVKQRMTDTKGMIEKNREIWSGTRDSENGRTIFEFFVSFERNFSEWIAESNKAIETKAISHVWDEKFEAARNDIDKMGELIELNANNQISLIEETKNNMIVQVIIIDILALVLALAISFIFLKIIANSLGQLSKAAGKIALGDIDIELDITSKDEIGKLAGDFKIMADSIKEKAEAAEKISKGYLDTDIRVRSDKDILSKSMKSIIENLKHLVDETGVLTKAASEGQLKTRGKAEKFEGGYRDIIEGINSTLDAVSEPILEIQEVLKEVSAGHLNVRVKGDYKGDYAELKNALNNTVDTLRSYIEEISRVLTEMSKGNLDVSLSHNYLGDFVHIHEALNTIITSLNVMINEITVAAGQVAAGSRQVSDSSQVLSQGAAEQASTIEELTVSLEEIARQTKQNAANASDADKLALTAKNNAIEGNKKMSEMLKAMHDINDASNNISRIIKVIDDIAFQTNILALNAAVEAARAGQYGKGFAVVAEEVRNLAARSANAAKETTQLIEGSIHTVDAGMKIAADTANALNTIVEEVTKAASLVQDISVASNEQATGIAQINQGVSQVSQVIQTNSATAQESAAASQELSSQAEVLKEMVKKFRLKTVTNMPVHGEIDPEVIKYMEDVLEKKEKGSKKKDKRNAQKDFKIELDNEDFGKY